MNEKVVGLIRTGGVILLMIIGTIFIIQAAGASDVVDSSTDEAVANFGKVGSAITFVIWLAWAALGAIVLFTIWAIIQNPKRFITPAISLVVFLVLGGLAYALASDAIIPELVERGGEVHPDMTASSLKWSGTGVKLTFILVIVAVALILVSSVMGAMRYFSSK
ncbi:MAG: hypothetical protein BM555_03650 [Crocinitomix sp. MedPE-SWsnd]|jgi:hypothetical protein|nr:MAG: hypothetical protein BM555_03650 [Crocinitomix sp. MedPE-SWsnd]